MVILDKRVNVQVWYKDRFSDWVVTDFSAYKNDSDIARVLGEVFDSGKVPMNAQIHIIQPNWANSGEDIELVEYRPFESVYTNTLHVRKTCKTNKKD